MMNRRVEQPPYPLGSDLAYEQRLDQLNALARRHGIEAARNEVFNVLHADLFWLEQVYGARETRAVLLALAELMSELIAVDAAANW
jgi:hypothetical protein